MTCFHVTLVHGTFARGAKWIQEDSDFRVALKTAVEQSGEHELSYDKPLSWTGANRFGARLKAAGQLSKQLLAHTKNDHDAVHLAIGHSHGGSAIAYALDLEPQLRDTLDGIAFLATPFIDARAEPGWRKSVRLLGLMFFALMWTVAFVALFTYFSDWFFTDGLVAVALAGFAIIALAGWRLESRVTAFLIAILDRRITRFINDVSTSQLPAKPDYLFIRAPADEAAGILSTVQTIAWFLSRVFYFFSSNAYRLIEQLQRIWHAGIEGKALLATISFVLVFGFLGASISTYLGFVDGMSLPQAFLKSSLSETIENGWVRIPVFAAQFVVLVLLAAAMAMLAATLGAALAHFAFGTSAGAAGPFVKLAVEPLPRGRWVLHRTGWPDGAGLAHSISYASPEAIESLSTWITGLAQR